MIKKVRTLLIFFLFTLSLAAEQKNIFFLHTYPDIFPWTENLNEGIEESLKELEDWALFTESLDYPLLGSSMNEEAWRDFVSQKYKSIEFDVVMAESDPACRIISEYGKELFGDIPKILFTSAPMEHGPDVYNLIDQLDDAVRDTFDMAMQQNPDSREILVISNNSEYPNQMKILLNAIEKTSLPLRILSDFSLEDLISILESLEGDEVLFYFPVFSDNSGESFVPRLVLAEISGLSPSPIYTFWGSLMNTGSAGGVVVDGRKISIEMFRAAEDYLRTGLFSNDYSTNQAYMDWKAIKNFRLDMQKTSGDIVYLNKPPPLFKAYFLPIMATSTLLLLLFLLISLLAVYKTSRANRALKEVMLLEQEKNWLEEVGKMAALMAHKMNNQLSGAYGFLQLAQNKTTGDRDLQDLWDRIMLSLENTRQTANQFISFSPGGEPRKQETVLDDFLGSFLTKQKDGANLKLSIHRRVKHTKITLDPIQIENALQYILDYCLKRKKENTPVSVSLEKDPGQTVRINLSFLSEEMLPVEDQGIFDLLGDITRDISDFYLTISRSVVLKHKGTLEFLKKNPDLYTFRISLPSG